MKKLTCLFKGHKWIYGGMRMVTSDLPIRQCERCGQFQYTLSMKLTSEGWVDDWSEAADTTYQETRDLVQQVRSKMNQ